MIDWDAGLEIRRHKKGVPGTIVRAVVADPRGGHLVIWEECGQLLAVRFNDHGNPYSLSSVRIRNKPIRRYRRIYTTHNDRFGVRVATKAFERPQQDTPLNCLTIGWLVCDKHGNPIENNPFLDKTGNALEVSQDG